MLAETLKLKASMVVRKELSHYIQDTNNDEIK
jgi:hypothetical protein